MATKTRGKGTAARRPPYETPPARELPAWVPPVVYALVTVLLFREYFFDGTSMLGRDSFALSYFARDFYTEFVQTFHRMPYWNPLLFGGLPFIEGMHGDIFYPPSLAMFFLDARPMWGMKMSLHVFLAGCFAYLWLRRGLKLGRGAAFFGGLVFMMGADLVSMVLPGGDGKLFVSALAPLAFWLAERAVAKRRLMDYALFSLGIALIMFTSHMQAAYFCVWGVSLYYLFRVWQKWREERSGAGAAKAVALYAVAGLLAVGAAAVQFLPPLGYLREHSHRAERSEPAEGGYAWSTSYSLNAEEIVALAVPEFVGEIAQTSLTRPAGGYWGRNPLKLNNEYAGLVPLLLVPILFLRRRTPQVWFFTGLAVLSLLYALGANTPFFRLFYLIPGVSMFRAPSIIIFLYGLSVATLGAIAVQQLLNWLNDHRAVADTNTARRALWIGAASFGALALLASAGVVTGVWASLFGNAIRLDALAANETYIRMGFWIAFLIAAAVAGAWELASRGALDARALLVALAIIAALDQYRASRPFVVNTALMNEQAAAGTLFRPDDVITTLQRLRDEGSVFRVADLGPLIGAGLTYDYNDLAVHGIEQLAGHHGNEMGRYRNLVGGDAAVNLGRSELRLAHVTNTEYFVSPARLSDPMLEEVYVGTRAALYRNVNALPRAYLAGSTEVVAGDAAIERLLSEDFDARSTVILAEPLRPGVEVQEGATGAVEWVDRQVDHYTLRVTADRPALLVVLDGWYPEWEATVDGQRAEIHRANHAFRAVAVPAGQHTVTFSYAAMSIRRGALISLGVLAVLLGVVATGAAAERRRATHAA